MDIKLINKCFFCNKWIDLNEEFWNGPQVICKKCYKKYKPE